MSGPDPILVLGATGRTGASMVSDLLRQGHAVRALVRDAHSARGRLGDAVELIEGDLRDPAALADAVIGCRRVVFVAGANGVDKRGAPREVEHDAVAALVRACAPDLERFVLLSSAGVTQPEHPHNCTYKSVLKWKLAGENALRASGRPYTIVRALGLRDRPVAQAGVRIVQGDLIAFGEDIAREDLALILSDIAGDSGERFAAPEIAKGLVNATVEVFNDTRLKGECWAVSRPLVSDAELRVSA